jgi:hypothetical protein
LYHGPEKPHFHSAALVFWKYGFSNALPVAQNWHKEKDHEMNQARKGGCFLAWDFTSKSSIGV